MSTCRGLYEYHNPQFPHLIQYKKLNCTQFTPMVACKTCVTLSSRSLREARKIWEFPEDSDTVINKNYGLHPCSSFHLDILSTLVHEGADLEVIEDKAEQLLDRTHLKKLPNNKIRPNEFTKLTELKQKYDKKHKFSIYSIYSLNSCSMNVISQRTYFQVVKLP